MAKKPSRKAPPVRPAVQAAQQARAAVSEGERPSWGGCLFAVLLLLVFVYYMLPNGARRAIFYTVFPPHVPECGAPENLHSVRRFAAPAWDYEEREKQAEQVQVTDIAQIGYAREARQRGCTASLTANGQSAAIAYSVGLRPFRATYLRQVTRGQPVLLHTRFHNVGKDGDFLHHAEPIGRDNLVAAMRAGLEAGAPGQPGTHYADGPAHVYRPEEIADVEPLGPCKMQQQGVRYACRLLIDHQAPVLQMLYGAPMVLEGEFVFVRDPDSERWQVAGDFVDAYRQGMSRATLARMHQQVQRFRHEKTGRPAPQAPDGN